MSDNATAILIALVISVSGVLLAWAEWRTGRCKSCGAHGHPVRLRDPRDDDEAGA